MADTPYPPAPRVEIEMADQRAVAWVDELEDAIVAAEGRVKPVVMVQGRWTPNGHRLRFDSEDEALLLRLMTALQAARERHYRHRRRMTAMHSAYRHRARRRALRRTHRR